MKTVNKVPVHDIAFNKLYLLNLLMRGNENHFSKEYETLYDAEEKNPRIASIMAKLSAEDIVYLTDTIESIL